MSIFSSNFSFHKQDLILHGDISYGVKEQFENEAKMAVRLANFISAFLQVISTLNSINLAEKFKFDSFLGF